MEMKPRTEYASLFVSCPKFVTEEAADQPFGLVRLEEQMLELAIDPKKRSSSSGSEDELYSLVGTRQKKMATKFSDVLLEPATVCSISWADQHQELLMCKVKAEADCISFSPKTIKRLEEELAQTCHLREYVERVERSKSFTVKCRQCDSRLHSHGKNEFQLGLLPSDEWLDISPQLDYFCGLSGSQCCGQHLEKSVHVHQGILGFSGGFNAESTRHWLPDESKIVFSNSFILLHKNEKTMDKEISEQQIEGVQGSILLCSNCNVQLGTTLKSRPDIFKLYLSVLNVYTGENQQRGSYILSRFNSMECFLAWIILAKCEHHSSMKLLIRSLDKTAQLLIWLLEPYVLLTKGVLQETSTEDASISSDNSTPADASSISFPALKILYKLFDSDSCKQDPRANGGDSSVAILEMPMGACFQLTELLLNSSLMLPPPLRALGQFYVGFIRLKDRID